MKVNEKCDVYSFGVVTLEVMMGRHPGDLISTLFAPSSSSPSTSSALDPETLLKDVLDQRLPLPEDQVAEIVVYIMKLAVKCMSVDPQVRPTMKDVCLELITPWPFSTITTWPPMAKPFTSMTLEDLFA